MRISLPYLCVGANSVRFINYSLQNGNFTVTNRIEVTVLRAWAETKCWNVADAKRSPLFIRRIHFLSVTQLLSSSSSYFIWKDTCIVIVECINYYTLSKEFSDMMNLYAVYFGRIRLCESETGFGFRFQCANRINKTANQPLPRLQDTPNLVIKYASGTDTAAVNTKSKLRTRRK